MPSTSKKAKEGAKVVKKGKAQKKQRPRVEIEYEIEEEGPARQRI